MPEDLTVEDLKKPHASHPNNPLLAGTLYLADYIQQVGSGTPEMIKQCRAQGVPEPEFALIRNVEFRIILSRDVYTEAVKFIKVGGRITNKEYQERFGLKKRQSTDDLKELENKGVLKRVGTTGKEGLITF